MLNYSNRLCNPTPFPVEWPYDKGVVLKIEPDGHLDVPANIVEDFRPDQPGHDAVKSQMDQYGIFLRDPTKPYEVQAIEAIGAAVKSTQGMYDDAYNNMRRRAAAQGTYDAEAFEETLKQNGYVNLREKAESLRKRLEIYKGKVKVEEVVYEEYDPEKTLVFLDPPKEFDSKIAMEVFLDENPKVKKQHEAWLEAERQAQAE